MDIQEIIRRLRVGESDRAIHQALGMHRDTVRKYRAWATAHDLLRGELPDLATLQQWLNETQASCPPPQNTSSVEPYGGLVKQLRAGEVEIAAIYQRLQEQGYQGSYQSVWRFVRKMEPGSPEATVRVECQPGQEAQVDFGYAGRMVDEASEKERPAWAFVMTLSYSRHQYVAFVFDQKVGTWLECHRQAFAFFGGVPQRVVVDNLKAAIVRACWDDPQVQQSYRECAAHYGFLIAPCRPYTPEHKGKVEQGGVHYVKRNFLGGRPVTSLKTANRDVLAWCLTTAGERRHGTTKEAPVVRFETERQALQALPTTAYDSGEWKLLKLHRDCYVVFDGAYYSAPFRYIGQVLRVRGGNKQVRIYSQDYQLLATHERAEQPGERLTHPGHLPPQKLPGWLLDRTACREEAAAVGPATLQVVSTLLDDPVLDRLPTVGRLLRLRRRFSDERLEASCRRALAFDDPNYVTVKRILTQNLDSEPPVEAEGTSTPPRSFVRSVLDLVGTVLGGVAWN